MNVETELRLDEDLIPGILNGTQRLAIQKGKREFAPEISIAGYMATVEGVDEIRQVLQTP
jgi:hypothetical protein